MKVQFMDREPLDSKKKKLDKGFRTKGLTSLLFRMKTCPADIKYLFKAAKRKALINAD